MKYILRLISFTIGRSVDLDEWTPQQLLTMKLGGNGNANKFFRKHGITDTKVPLPA